MVVWGEIVGKGELALPVFRTIGEATDEAWQIGGDIRSVPEEGALFLCLCVEFPLLQPYYLGKDEEAL
jgi:hypothetical protein